jgi:hypothetical protein
MWWTITVWLRYQNFRKTWNGRKSTILEVVEGRILQVNLSTFQASLHKHEKVYEWPCITSRGYEDLQRSHKQNFATDSAWVWVKWASPPADTLYLHSTLSGNWRCNFSHSLNAVERLPVRRWALTTMRPIRVIYPIAVWVSSFFPLMASKEDCYAPHLISFGWTRAACWKK